MNMISASPFEVSQRRRGFLRVAASATLMPFLFPARGVAQPAAVSRDKLVGTGKGFASLKQVPAGLLDVSYAELGPASGQPVILLHGWPYDIHSFIDVAPALAADGYRVLVPYLRGYGPTRFLSPTSLRNGQPAALAQDAIDFMDALKIDRAIFAGFDWGARTAGIHAGRGRREPRRHARPDLRRFPGR